MPVSSAADPEYVTVMVMTQWLCLGAGSRGASLPPVPASLGDPVGISTIYGLCFLYRNHLLPLYIILKLL